MTYVYMFVCMCVCVYVCVCVPREVMQLYDITFPEVRIQNECRCPSSHPALKDNNHLYCVQNAGDGRLLTEEYRIRRGQKESHPLQLVNDGIIDSKWIGDPGQDIDVITINLEQVYEV